MEFKAMVLVVARVHMLLADTWPSARTECPIDETHAELSGATCARGGRLFSSLVSSAPGGCCIGANVLPPKFVLKRALALHMFETCSYHLSDVHVYELIIWIPTRYTMFRLGACCMYGSMAAAYKSASSHQQVISAMLA